MGGNPSSVGNTVRRTAVIKPAAVGNAEPSGGRRPPMPRRELNRAREQKVSFELECLDDEDGHLPAGRGIERLRKVEGVVQERRHLVAANRVERTVIAAAAAPRDVLGGELLDPVGQEARGGGGHEDSGGSAG